MIKDALFTVQAEHRKKVASLSAGKVSRDRRPLKPPKPVDKVRNLHDSH